MERIHPNLNYVTSCAAIAFALGLVGCRSSSSGVAGSPFMAPDRVAPPNTRALAPGQAQPYYQGDPLPAMQSTAGPPAAAIAAVPQATETQTPTGRTLTWGQSSAIAAAQPANVAPPTASAPLPLPQPQSPSPVPTAAPANEALVAVPNDGDPLRFPLPAPQPPETAAPIASAAPIPAQAQLARAAAAQPNPNVLQASYSAPIPSAPPLQVNSPPVSQPQPAASPWRSPQIAQTAPPPGYAPQPLTTQQQFGASSLALPAPPAIPANTVAATLRAVEAPEPGDPMPRVRMPGYVASQASADGFRPRTSMQ